MNKLHQYLLLNKSVTLLELLISISLLGVIVIGFFSIDLFSHFHVITSDQRAKLQNEVLYVLEHMAKNLTATDVRGGAIGDANNPPVTLTTIGGDNAMLVWIDYNSNGQKDASDKQIAYRYSASTYEIWYYSNYTDSPASYEVLTLKKIRSDFSSDTTKPTYRTYDSADNYINVQITACWDPDGSPSACGTGENPSVNLLTRIKMPSVSTH